MSPMEPFDHPEWVFEPKSDGYRLFGINLRRLNARIRTRNTFCHRLVIESVRLNAEDLAHEFREFTAR